MLSNPLYIRLLFFVLCQFFSDCFHLHQAKGTCLYYSSITCSDTLYSLSLLTFKQCLFVFALLYIYLASLFLHICVYQNIYKMQTNIILVQYLHCFLYFFMYVFFFKSSLLISFLLYPLFIQH